MSGVGHQAHIHQGQRLVLPFRVPQVNPVLEPCLVKWASSCANDMFSACYSGQNTKKRIGDVKDRHGWAYAGEKKEDVGACD